MSGASPRILVVGIGGIGGIIAAHLSEVGADVTALCRNDEIRQAVSESGYQLVGDGGIRSCLL